MGRGTHSKKRFKITDLRSTKEIIGSSSRSRYKYGAREFSDCEGTERGALISKLNEQSQPRKTNLNCQFNQVIEDFCEIVIWYRELFIVQCSSPGNSEDGLGKCLSIDERASNTESDSKIEIDEVFIKTLLDNQVETPQLDPQKSKEICEKILQRIRIIQLQIESADLKTQLKAKIQKLSKTVCFFLKDKMVIHGETTVHGHYELGHVLDLRGVAEYLCRVRDSKPSGNGQKWVGSARTQGYFEDGKLCGYGQTSYDDGSFYR